MKPNIIFITTDHQRADTINMVQNEKEVTPNLNKLSKESFHFQRAYTTCPLSVPARTALATGIFPTQSKVVINDLKNIPEETREIKSIHEILSEKGYSVSHFGMQHITLKPTLEERVNFDKIVTDDDYEKICKRENIPLFGVEEDKVLVKERHGELIEDKFYTGSRVSTFEKDINLFRDRFYMNSCLEYLEEKNIEEPMALFINLWAPHPPFNLPDKYLKKFENPILPKNINLISENEPQNRRKGIAAQLAENHDENHWKKVWQAYLGLTNYADELIGELIKKLKEKNLYDNSIIIFTADHGDHLGQHKMFQKMEMYEQAINVPLLIKFPEHMGKRVDIPVSHLDIVPTLLEIVGENSSENMFGKSIFSLINDTNLEDREVFSQYSGNQVAIGDIRRAIVNKKYKYIYDPRDKDEFFDLEKDILEMRNIAEENILEKEKKVLKHKLKKWVEKTNDWIKLN